MSDIVLLATPRREQARAEM